MENIPLEISENIFIYLEKQDILNFLYTCKKNHNVSFYWEILGKIYHPILKINCRKDYTLKNPYYVSEKEYQQEIKKFPHAQYWLKRDEKDHLYSAFIRNIYESKIKINKLHKFMEKNKSKLSMDWRISITKAIEELEDFAEQENEDMKEHHNFKMLKNTLK